MIKMVGRWFGIGNIGKEELARMRKPAERALLKAALKFEKGVKEKLKGPRSGRIYGTHQASAPGEPPALLSGALRQSITHTMPEWDGDEVGIEVGTALVYAAILEWGGVAGNNARILPRPYMAPTYLELQDILAEILSEAVQTQDKDK